MVRLRLAAAEAFLMFRRAAALCLLLAMVFLSVAFEILDGTFVRQRLLLR